VKTVHHREIFSIKGVSRSDFPQNCPDLLELK
jgi:hypothetical protein